MNRSSPLTLSLAASHDIRLYTTSYSAPLLRLRESEPILYDLYCIFSLKIISLLIYQTSFFFPKKAINELFRPWRVFSIKSVSIKLNPPPHIYFSFCVQSEREVMKSRFHNRKRESKILLSYNWQYLTKSCLYHEYNKI